MGKLQSTLHFTERKGFKMAAKLDSKERNTRGRNKRNYKQN